MKNMIPNTGCPSIWKQTGGINKQFPKSEKKEGLSGKRTRETMDNIK